MPSPAKSVEIELMHLANPHYAKLLSRFFQTRRGEYGAGDKFLGINVPVTRAVLKHYQQFATLEDAEQLLRSPWHEIRFAGAVLFRFFSERANEKERGKICKRYLAQRGLNNWDLIDFSAPAVVGTYYQDKSITPLKKLATSKSLWKRRIAIVSTLEMIKQKRLDPTFEICELLMHDSHDLIHKACGWALREAGKIDQKQLDIFLQKHLHHMPRTMLRYAIEKFPVEKRKRYLST